MGLRTRRLAAAALGVALLSLAGNAYLLWRLYHPEPLLRPVLQRMVARVAPEDGTLRYEVRIPAGTPLRFDIPVNESFRIRVDTVIPIRTRVRVPFDTPVGRRSVSIPINADVPVRTVLPLQVRHTFRLRTATHEEIVVPLEIDLGELGLDSIF